MNQVRLVKMGTAGVGVGGVVGGVGERRGVELDLLVLSVGGRGWEWGLAVWIIWIWMRMRMVIHQVYPQLAPLPLHLLKRVQILLLHHLLNLRQQRR